MSEADTVLVERDGPITIVSINRPHCRNAVDGATARKLYDAFLAFDADATASVMVCSPRYCFRMLVLLWRVFPARPVSTLDQVRGRLLLENAIGSPHKSRMEDA